MLWSRSEFDDFAMECRKLQRPSCRAACRCGASPPTDGEVLVTTGFDLLMAQFGVAAASRAPIASSYDDEDAPYHAGVAGALTPASAARR